MDPARESRMRALATELLELAGGGGALERGEELVDARVTMHMGGLTVRGRDRWRGFVRYLRHRRRGAPLRLACDETRIEEDRITVQGRLRGGDTRAEWPIAVTFRIADGRVVELWTRRANYTAVFGESFTTNRGFLVEMLRAAWWCRTHDRG